MEESIIW